MRLIGTTTVLLALGFSTPCLAWGTEGHQIIAHIAARELTPAARVRVQELLGADAERALVEVSTWADEVRPQRPETAPWHYVDIPITSPYVASRDCPRNNCIVAQIDREIEIAG